MLELQAHAYLITTFQLCLIFKSFCSGKVTIYLSFNFKYFDITVAVFSALAINCFIKGQFAQITASILDFYKDSFCNLRGSHKSPSNS